MPLVSLFLGGCMLLSFWLGGDVRQGLYSLAVLAGLAALLAFGGRSETIRMARGDQKDERWSLIDLRATAIAGNAIIAVVIAMFMWEISHGRDGGPYGQLGAISGLVYLIAAGVQRVRG